MKVLKWLLIILVALIATFAGVGFVLPDSTHVERAIVINAKPATVFAVLDGFRQFNKWAPWAEVDPKTQYAYEGPVAGVGAKESWKSDNPDVGFGSQEILEATMPSKIRNRLVFGDFTSENYATFTLSPEGEAGEGTRVVWGYDSSFHGNIVYRYFGLAMDGMLGADYEKGLAKLKAFVESLPKDDIDGVELVNVAASPIVYIEGESPAEQSGQVMSADYAKLQAFLGAAGAKAAAPPLAITREFNDETKFWKFNAALPLAAACPPVSAEIQCGNSYGGTALRVTHKGTYASLNLSYQKLIAYKAIAGLVDNGGSWEQYMSDSSAADADLITHIYWPVR
jgi:effector-binding domain-containing protein